MKSAINIEELRHQARRSVPRIVFDMVDGGAEDERGMRRNRTALDDITLVPRYLVDIKTRSQATDIFGCSYAMPVGIAPTGLANLVRAGTDVALAGAARDARIPFLLSTAATTSIERIGELAHDHTWFQLYIPRDWDTCRDLIRRAERAGLQTLVVTVDVPFPAKRERDARNGFTVPLRPSLANLFDIATHPMWALRLLANGTPRFETMSAYLDPDAGAQSLAAYIASEFSGGMTWDLFDRIRELWSGHLVLKGILNPDDARRAQAHGADGIIVSNHGGRQLDTAPASIEALAPVVHAVGSEIPVMLDSGIRRGSDVVKALALGADYVFVGRATLYGAAANGRSGIETAIAILRDEIDRCLAQIGCPDVRQLDVSYVRISNSSESNE